MHVFSAVNVANIRHWVADKWSVDLICPWCGERAWGAADYFLCRQPGCPGFAGSAYDMVAKVLGGYVQAEHAVAGMLHREPDLEAAVRRQAERLVMDTWVGFCNSPRTSEASELANKLQSKHGMDTRQCATGVRVLDRRQVSRLLSVAQATGAAFPETWLENPPGPMLASVVQSRPHTIDRIILGYRADRSAMVIWNKYSAGFCGLLNLSRQTPRLLAVDLPTALSMQHLLEIEGSHEEIVCLFIDDRGVSPPPPHWEVHHHLLTACPRVPGPGDPHLHNDDDIVRMQWVFNQFDDLARTVRASTAAYAIAGRARRNHLPWSSVRIGSIISLVSDSDTHVPASAATLFERTGSLSRDAAHLIDYYKQNNRFNIASDFARLAMTRIIHRDENVTVRETASEYQLSWRGGTSLLANFSLRVLDNVSFDERGEAFCHAMLHCGKAELEVLFPQNLLQDKINGLQDELQRQLAAQKKTAAAGKLPTVVDSNKFRQYIVPHLRQQVSEANTVTGIDRLGWSSDRRAYNFPGFVATVDGRYEASRLLCPSVPILKLFESPVSWAERCPVVEDASCRDIVAMLLASCARYYRLCASRPILISQSSDATLALDKIQRGLGQIVTHELNQNSRDGNRVQGVFGYPIVVVGPRSASKVENQVPYIHLTDQGYNMVSSPLPEQAAAAGRAAQFALLRVVEWCLATGADDFREIPSMHQHRSLMREGKWLMEHVCDVEGWEVSMGEQSALDNMLSQIPFGEAGRRITLIDGTDLIIDIRGLEVDTDGIMREARDMGTIAAIEEAKVMAPAVRLFPAIAGFYGQEPDVTQVVSSI